MYECLKGLKPDRVFEIFSQLCQIPHGSKNEKEISDYIYNFCTQLGLEVWQDKASNLIIKKAATLGYERAPVVVLQAHLDMVCEKNAEKIHDFEKDSIQVLREGDRIYADETTLGADNATGVAFAMCVLESNDIPHPPWEVVLTVDEEAGMSGIKVLDFSKIQGRVIINLDCSDEGIVVGCAGTTAVRMVLDLEREELPDNWGYRKVCIRGLRGGHSGLDINKERANANLLLARVLSSLEKQIGVKIGSFEGGQQSNAICREAEAEIGFPLEKLREIQDYLKKSEQTLKKEFKVSDPDVCVFMTSGGKSSGTYTAKDSQRLLDAVLSIDCGVIAMNVEIPGVPETSGNMGMVNSICSKVAIRILYRSCLDSKKQYVLDKCERLARLLNADFEIESSSPEWEYKADSRLKALIQRTFKERFCNELVVEVSHGGNECGTFFQRFPEADIVCTGTQINDAHTPNESVLVSTIQKEWEMLCLTLKGMIEY